MGRILPVIGMLIGIAWLSAGSNAAATEQGRWCAFVGMGSGNIRELCHFNDFQACVQEVIAGDRGHCGPNPYWGRPQAEPARHHRDRRRN